MLEGVLPPTPWDVALGAAMAHHGRVLAEEQVLDRLLADLADDRCG